MITKKEIINIQKKWADWIIKLGQLDDRKLLENETDDFINELYAYNEKKVLFKPTKVSEIQFRLTEDGAKSYFIGGNINYPEDKGFIFNKWIKIRFDNSSMIIENNRALVMGNYYFTDVFGKTIKVEYSFGYIKQGKNLKIDLHHSSLPYKEY